MARTDRASADYPEPETNVADQPDPATLPTNKARAGESRGNMRVVLIVSILLVIVAFAAIYATFFATNP